MLPEVIRRLPPIGKPAGSAVVDRLYWIRKAGEKRGNIQPFNLLYVDSIRHAKSLDLGQILKIFADDAENWIAENARRRLFIHAGVVGWKGRAILLPGRSMSGKSTLVRALVEAGATYYSDEFAVLDEHGLVHPYPRALSVREDPRREQERIPLEELATPHGTRPLPVGLVAITSYRPDGRWRPRELSGGRAALAMLASTISARSQPQLALKLLARIARKAVVLKGNRGEAAQTAAEILGGDYRSESPPAERVASGGLPEGGVSGAEI